MDLEKREQEIYIAGYLVYDIMIVENLGDHADAEVAKGVKQFTENFIKKRLKEVKYRTVEETWHVPLSEKESLIKKLLNMQNCLKKRRRPLKSAKRRSLTWENHQLPKNPNNAAKRNF